MWNKQRKAYSYHLNSHFIVVLLPTRIDFDYLNLIYFSMCSVSMHLPTDMIHVLAIHSGIVQSTR